MAYSNSWCLGLNGQVSLKFPCFNFYLMTNTVSLYLKDRYNTVYKRYNVTVHKGNAQDNTTPAKWHHRKELAIHVDVICVRSSKRCIIQEYSVNLKCSTPKEQSH